MLSATLIALLILLLLLAVPVTLNYEVSWQRQFRGKARLQWLFGLVRVQLAAPADRRPVADAQPGDDSTEVTPKRARGKFNPLPALRQKRFRRRIFRFARDLWRALRKRDLYLRIRVGLGDPADTGQLWAFCGPLSGLLATVEHASIELEPEFVDAVFELDSGGKLSVIPLQLLYRALGLLCSPTFWRGLRQMRRTA